QASNHINCALDNTILLVEKRRDGGVNVGWNETVLVNLDLPSSRVLRSRCWSGLICRSPRHSSRNTFTEREQSRSGVIPETNNGQFASVSLNHAGWETAAMWKKLRQLQRDSVGRKGE